LDDAQVEEEMPMMSLAISDKMYVVVGILATALAQISLKKAGQYEVMHLKWGVYLLLSLVSYVVSFLAYYMALKFFDISKVQPIMMASIVSIIALYGFFIGENFSHLRILGIILAIISVVLISKS
jgi:uncharacterized membrane protein